MTMSLNVVPWVAATRDPQTEDTALIAFALNVILADSFAVYLKTRKFGWTLSGSRTRAHFLLLDDQASQILETTDAIAERICQLDACALRSTGDFTMHRRISDNDAEQVSAHAMFTALHHDNLVLAEGLHRLRTMVNPAHDATTASMIDFWAEEAERRALFLFEVSQP